MTPELGRQRTLEGSLAANLFRFGSPLAIGMGLQVTFNLVDAYLVSRLGGSESGAALGAIGICDQIAAIGSIISYGLSTASATVTSHRFGAGDFLGARRVAWQSTLLVAALGLVFAIFGLLGAGWLMHDVVGAQGLVAELGTQYLRVIVGGNITIFLLLHLTTLARALGSSKTPVALILFSNALNLVLAVLLVYGPGSAPGPFYWGPPLARALSIPRLGLVGAAWATVLARLKAQNEKAARKALEHARKVNPAVEEFITGRQKLPRKLPEFATPGSPEEAAETLKLFGEVWSNDREALYWLFKQDR